MAFRTFTEQSPLYDQLWQFMLVLRQTLQETQTFNALCLPPGSAVKAEAKALSASKLTPSPVKAEESHEGE